MAASAPFIFSEAEFGELAEGNEPLDRFGPATDRPLVAVRVDRGAEALAAFARTLPCPVVAIGGKGTLLAATCDVAIDRPGQLACLHDGAAAAPLAALVLVHQLRASERLGIADALIAESLAFATVQQGPDFRRWRSTAPLQAPATRADVPLTLMRDGGLLRLTMTDEANRNAIGIAMRDALSEALDLALADPTIDRVQFDAAGRCFSTGGDPAEFGEVADPATAHWIRSLRLPANRAARLGERLSVRIDGAAIGAGIELAAFAGTIVATPRSWFQLPELSYGLIPGAGGTVSIPRRIGRQRTAYLVLSGRRLSAAQALEWGLIDAVAS